MSEMDVTFPDSPAPVINSSKKNILPTHLSPLAAGGGKGENKENNNNPSGDRYAYNATSTPAPSNSNYTRSNSTIHPPNSAQSGNTTVVAPTRAAGTKSSAINQHSRTTVGSGAGGDELELPSLDESAIGMVHALEEDREDMVVLSGSGEESTGNLGNGRGGNALRKSITTKATRENERMGEAVEEAKRRDDSLDDGRTDTNNNSNVDLSAALNNISVLSSSSSPPPPTRTAHVDYTVPLVSSPQSPPPLDGNNQIIPSSERARRLLEASASAHVSFSRRRSVTANGRKSGVGIVNPNVVFELDEDASSSENSPVVRNSTSPPPLPSAANLASPLREISNNTTSHTDGTPGIGRHASPMESPHSQIISSAEHYTPSPSSHLQQQQQYGDFATTPKVTFSIERTDAERRKEHLLATLRSTTKPRMAKGTPHPINRRRRSSSGVSAMRHASPGDDSLRTDEEGDEEQKTDNSSQDLTTFNNHNTSLPSGGGVGEGKSSRFNGAKLNAYLHTLNTHLTEENVSLAKSLGNTTKEVERLKKDKRKLEKKVLEMSVGGVSLDQLKSGEEEEGESRAEELEKELRGLVDSHGGINVLQRKVVEELGGDDSDAVERLSSQKSTIERLEKELELAKSSIDEQEKEINELREKVVQSHTDNSTSTSGNNTQLVEVLQREVFELKDQLNLASGERDSKIVAVERLRSDFVKAAEENEIKFNGVRQRTDELLLELEGKDGELADQEAQFAEKMRLLEEELCRVMEEQEEQLEKTKEELVIERERIGKLEEERDAIKMELDRVVAASGTPPRRGEKDDEQVRLLKVQISSLESTIAKRDTQIVKMNLEMDDLEQKLSIAASRESELERQSNDRADELKQMEEALDESARQLVQNEEELDHLRANLASEKKVVSSLSTQISQLSLHKTKAKSPLGNEVFSHSRDAALASLEEELEVAHKEIESLKLRLTNPEIAVTKSTVEIKDLEIKTLESHKVQLEERVESLRQQVSSQLSPGNRTPNKNDSLFFKSILGVKTPRTPGQFVSELPPWSPGAEGNSTITPLLSQIQELELVVEQLQRQLSNANSEIDHKLDVLEAAGSSTISLARQLSAARERVALLESELEKLLGANGSMQRVRTRLMNVACPGCKTTFDANKLVRLRIDRTANAIAFAGDGSPKSPEVNESLRAALAGVNAKLSELKTENNVLQDTASRAHALAAEKAAIVKQHTALQKDFESARSEIAGLEGELRSERTRLRNLANEQTLNGRAKAALESRLSTTESDLQGVNRDIAGAVGPDALERLRREKATLISERADLLKQLADVNEQVARLDNELLSSKQSQSDMQSQLDQQIAEIQTLRDSLQSREAAQRLLQDERGDILRGVAGLQADLNRVRQDAISLGLDLANVRRERDEIGARKQGGDSVECARLQEELSKTRRKLGVFEQKVAEHVCPSDANALVEMKARHSQEAKGLLVMIRYLKVRISREAAFRDDLAYQKEYLSAMIREKQSTIDSTISSLAQFGLAPPPASRRRKPSFKGVGTAVIAISRMQILSREWKAQNVPKTRLRAEAYPSVRGHPFQAAS